MQNFCVPIQSEFKKLIFFYLTVTLFTSLFVQPSDVLSVHNLQ
jgi:hypothetical protein